jgi:hypothetical protein
VRRNIVVVAWWSADDWRGSRLADADEARRWTKFRSFGLTLNEEQIPQIVGKTRNQS